VPVATRYKAVRWEDNRVVSISSTGTLDLSNASDRARIFSLLEHAIGNLETNLGTSFNATTHSQL
jgi:hypothetical protein